MPRCVDQELLLGALVDGELDAANASLVEAHIARCEGCREEIERIEAVRDLLQVPGVSYHAPESLVRRIAQAPELSAKPVNENRIPRWVAPALGGAIAASLAMLTVLPPGPERLIDEELVSSHVRSLQPGHLTDVETSDQHVVKPWFNGRIDFSPPVPELADAGFPLAGGRLDSIDGRTVAALVYHRRLHVVNLFVWPAKDAADRSFSKDGFLVTEWSRNGLRYAAISDVAPPELKQFEALFVKRTQTKG